MNGPRNDASQPTQSTGDMNSLMNLVEKKLERSLVFRSRIAEFGVGAENRKLMRVTYARSIRGLGTFKGKSI